MARGPVKHTCPNIDRVITQIRSAIQAAHNGQTTYKELKDDYFGEIIHELFHVESHLEELRQSNDSLRQYGAEQEDRANNLEEELASIQQSQE